MNDANREWLERYMELERERLLKNPPPPPKPSEPQTIHYTELPEDTSGGRLSTAWNFYRREVVRLLAEGHEGRWVLIQGTAVVSIWDTEAEARAAAERYGMQDMLIHRVLVREPIIRGGGYDRRWR